MVLYPLHWCLSLLASILRLGAGYGGGKAGQAPLTQTQPPLLPVLYEFEACPWCRISREAISAAGISVLVRPCPKTGERFRPDVKRLGGKAQFPYWIEGGAETGMYESGAIAKLMRTRYGAFPFVHRLGPFSSILSSYAILLRAGFGRSARQAKPQTQPLVFYGSEASPAARLVKEELCALELEYIWHTGKRDAQSRGAVLEDPQHDMHFESAYAALRHLRLRYRVTK